MSKVSVAHERVRSGHSPNQQVYNNNNDNDKIKVNLKVTQDTGGEEIKANESLNRNVQKVYAVS